MSDDDQGKEGTPLLAHEMMQHVFESIIKKTDLLSVAKSMALPFPPPVSITIIEHTTSFNGKSPAPLTLGAYIARIHKYSDCPQEVFVASMIYIDRIVKRHPSFFITSHNVHRFFGRFFGVLLPANQTFYRRVIMLCITVADKFWNDSYLSNTDYATIGGLTNEELNKLEHETLALLGFELYIDRVVFEEYYRGLRRLFGTRMKLNK